MKTTTVFPALLLLAILPLTGLKAQDSGFYSLKMKNIKGEEVDFSQFRGKKVLLVNTASECGFTPQYEGLEELYKTYGKDGLVVLGFPANNFGGQEPGSNLEIASFCKENYGVTFPMFEKSSVKGGEKNEVFDWLTSKSANGWNEQEPTWNFCKYLVDEKGKLVAFFPSKVEPMSEEITSKL
ncbi:glutathione peroxidase [Anseongella ginsenosidimutans]|uniref:Glutathione peroxidase n=1 Tax=Anseongella ginsenosidimutans TaxID=496056 RepID=A0A4R3KMD8_9SPHI|nr:glutathione peroxidase [Anseongella ginsenosidimutans]QEC52712.1 glutathione peroxidase [Anseongella ginsenosidimutans]TCS85461.1 glutathione peroxidase [Anseongella ginsenosidimutans]